MYRVYNAGPAVDKYCEETSEGNSHWDLCGCCYAAVSEDTVPATIGLHAELGDPDGTKIDMTCNAPLPMENEYLYSNDYRCYMCDAPLWDEDEILRLKEVE